VQLAPRIPQSWVVKDLTHVIEDLLDWDIWILPRVYNTRRDVLEDGRCHLPSRLVKNVGEMILGKQ